MQELYGVSGAASSPTSSWAQQFAEIMTTNDLLTTENRLFDSHLHRHGGDDLTTPGDKAFRSRHSTAELTQYQRLSLAAAEHEYRSKQLKQLEEKAQDDISLLKAIREGIRIRMNEIKKETYEFNRDLLIGGKNPRTGKMMAEKVVRYFDEKLKTKTALIEKIKLKNAAMKTHRVKMDQQVKHKEEQGDSLHSIDFHQLQIKNEQFQLKIEDRNNELRKLKTTTGKTVQVLNDKKRELNRLLADNTKLASDINDRKLANLKLSEELARVEAEVAKERKKYKKYKIQQSNPDMPQVLDYVNQKSEMYDLEAAVRNWTRKCEIVEMAAKRARTIQRLSARQPNTTSYDGLEATIARATVSGGGSGGVGGGGAGGAAAAASISSARAAAAANGARSARSSGTGRSAPSSGIPNTTDDSSRFPRIPSAKSDRGDTKT